MVERATWVVTVRDKTYVWPRGSVVQVFGRVEYVRRLTGELRDAQPAKLIRVSGFDDIESFRAWCSGDAAS